MKKQLKFKSNYHTFRASAAVLSIWSSTVKSDEEKSKCAGLAQQIGFHSATLDSLQCLVEGESHSVHL
jgi:hypothetical protein